jgi:F0F1-type ATP synthase membrane subunit b/b'
MNIDIGSLVAQILNFLILFFLFRAFLTKPIIKVIEDRRNLITKLENADNAYEEKIQLAKIQAREIVQE